VDFSSVNDAAAAAPVAEASRDNPRQHPAEVRSCVKIIL